MNRREILLAAGCCLLPGAGFGQSGAAILKHPLMPAWTAWKETYLAQDGRVVDSLQQGASHSESQGYGLLLAATVGDETAFDLIDDWTVATLAVRDDNLLAWRWLPTDPRGVSDFNNASDGDLFYVWALLRAADAFDRPELRDRASAMASDLATSCIVPHPDQGGRLLFAPAASGFNRDTGIVMNFSYYMSRAMFDIATQTGITAFATCATDGEALLADLAATGLTPDWTEVRAGDLVTATGLSDAHGYEALRVPLFLIWSGRASHPAVARQAAFHQMAGLSGSMTPTVMDRLTGEVRETSPDAGYAAIVALTNCARQGLDGSSVPFFTVDQPYYPATLHLMTLLAIIEANPNCIVT